VRRASRVSRPVSGGHADLDGREARVYVQLDRLRRLNSFRSVSCTNPCTHMLGDLPVPEISRMLPFVVNSGDVARWLVMAAPLLVGGVVIELRRQRMTGRCARPVRSGRYSLRGLAAALVIILIVAVAAWLGAVALLLQVLTPLLILGGIVYLYTRRNRERDRNASLRGEIEARVCFETALERVSILGTGGFGGTRGVWIPVRGPKRLIVGADAFMISAPQALREFVFRGSESSIAFHQAVNDDRIMITGQADGRQVQLAITRGNLLGIWQALAGTGAAVVLRIRNHPVARAGNPQLRSTWSSPSSSQTPNPSRGCRV
jgi:hypothetical protein